MLSCRSATLLKKVCSGSPAGLPLFIGVFWLFHACKFDQNPYIQRLFEGISQVFNIFETALIFSIIAVFGELYTICNHKNVENRVEFLNIKKIC